MKQKKKQNKTKQKNKNKNTIHFNPAETIYREVAYKYMCDIQAKNILFTVWYIVYVSTAALNVLSM